MSPDSLINTARGLAKVTKFALERIEHRLPPDVRDQLLPMAEDLSEQLERAAKHPAVIQQRLESIQADLSILWDQLQEHFSAADQTAIATVFNDVSGVPWNPELFLSVDGLDGLSQGLEASGAVVDGMGFGDGNGVLGTTVVTAGSAGAGIAAIGVGNAIGGAGVAAGSATAVGAANALVGVGATAVTASTTAVSSVPVIGGALASGITATAGTVASAGAVIGSTVVVAAPVVLPALAIWGLWKLFKDD